MQTIGRPQLSRDVRKAQKTNDGIWNLTSEDSRFNVIAHIPSDQFLGRSCLLKILIKSDDL